ncbi:hypothetical protein MAM1_0172d07187, partial [Mucor ambiguus]
MKTINKSNLDLHVGLSDEDEEGAEANTDLMMIEILTEQLELSKAGAKNSDTYKLLNILRCMQEGSLEWFNAYNVFTAFFERKFRASTIQSTVAIVTTIKVLGHANVLLDIATNDSFKDENEGDAVDSKANNNGIANAVEAKVINGHAEQEA